MTALCKTCLGLPGALALLLVSLFASGHDSRPAYVEVEETTANTFRVRWKVPNTLSPGQVPRLDIPLRCRGNGQSPVRAIPGAWSTSVRIHCPEGLSGALFGLNYPAGNPGLGTLFRIDLLSGESRTLILDPDQHQWQVPAAESLGSVATQYAVLGVEHIFLGLDHLLFVACLLFIARTPRRILVTVTGFTLAHSLTLALATLGLVRLPVPAVEAVIALSIVFLACEIARPDRGSWTWRYPVAVSISFGLLHGFGFAAVLQDIGLPQTALAGALLFFNLGVELGQLLFILVLALAVALLAAIFRQGPGKLLGHRHANLAGSYVIGSLASFWLVQRLAGFW